MSNRTIQFISYQPPQPGAAESQRSTRRRVIKSTTPKTRATRNSSNNDNQSSSGLQFSFYKPRNRIQEQERDIIFSGPLTFYEYQDLGDDGGYNVRIAGPKPIEEMTVRTVYRMREVLDQEDQVTIEDELLSDDECDLIPINTKVAEKYVWTKQYKVKNVRELIDLVVNQNVSVQAAAVKACIKIPTAYKMVDEYRKDSSKLPEYKLITEVKKPNHNQKMQQQHTEFLDQLLHDDPLHTMKELRFKLLERYPGNDDFFL